MVGCHALRFLIRQLLAVASDTESLNEPFLQRFTASDIVMARIFDASLLFSITLVNTVELTTPFVLVPLTAELVPAIPDAEGQYRSDWGDLCLQLLLPRGDPIPSNLIGKVEEYLPDDFVKMLIVSEDEKGQCEVRKPCSWIHSDIMDDNIHMEPNLSASPSFQCASEADLTDIHNSNGHSAGAEAISWHPSHILDFSDMSIGDPLCDLIPIHLDVFRGDIQLFKHLLQSYKLPLVRRISSHAPVERGSKLGRLSYHAMCYCIMHDDNVLGAIFSLWKELRTAESWEEVEEKVWGELNNYEGSR